MKRFSGRYRVERTRWRGVPGHLWEQVALPRKVSRGSVLWSPANTGPLPARNQALTIHDLSPLEHPEWFNKAYSTWYRLFLPILARKVQVIFTPSEYVKQQVMKRFGIEKVVVTPDGVDTSVFHPAARPHSLELPQKYILFVGSIQPRKNLTALMQAWREIKDEFKNTWLVVAGGASPVFRAIHFRSNERVRFLNYVPEDTLPGLYANAEVFVLPSLDEGFGLPALEAMACGTPVIVSNGGALPDVVGEAGLIFDLSQPDTLSQKLRDCLGNPSLCASLTEKGQARAKQFSWQTTADLVWKTLHDL